MSFKALSEKIDFELVKELSKLTPEQAAMKAARDKELHDIIEGKDDRILRHAPDHLRSDYACD